MQMMQVDTGPERTVVSYIIHLRGAGVNEERLSRIAPEELDSLIGLRRLVSELAKTC